MANDQLATRFMAEIDLDYATSAVLEGHPRVLGAARVTLFVREAVLCRIPAGPNRKTILAITYILVVFSILVQGLTFRRLAAGIY